MAGDVVSIDPAINAGVKKSSGAYDSQTIGVISTQPGLIIGDNTQGGSGTALVALAGRVPVKVSLENGTIKPGDALTPSSTPGVAMKATKAGAIIGQSLGTYDGNGPNYVLVFIKNSHANGTKITDVLEGVTTSNTDAQQTLAQKALAYFSTEGKVQTDATDISEIYTDRVSAALEVITPQLTANNVSTDSITSSTNTNIAVDLKSNGRLIIQDSEKAEVASIDDKGNATFKGTVTADKIKANQIEGLEVFTNKISALEQAQQASTGTTTQPGVASNGTTNATVNLKDITAQTAIVSGDLTSNGTLFANGALKVTGPAEFLGNSIFYKLATFIDKTIFKSSVNFEAPTTFGDKIIVNNNTAGTVKIPIGETKIVVQFSKPYNTPPIINATPIGIIAPKYGVTNITKDGFEIDIDPAQPTETQFNWFAVETSQP
ncbi:hypothetical protein H0W80_02475 [Candidatus Saccharibacteria bacterium]|nr:hypothetical protein [Candidatus Saccharibacteria bacterium]